MQYFGATAIARRALQLQKSGIVGRMTGKFGASAHRVTSFGDLAQLAGCPKNGRQPSLSAAQFLHRYESRSAEIANCAPGRPIPANRRRRGNMQRHKPRGGANAGVHLPYSVSHSVIGASFGIDHALGRGGLNGVTTARCPDLRPLGNANAATTRDLGRVHPFASLRGKRTTPITCPHPQRIANPPAVGQTENQYQVRTKFPRIPIGAPHIHLLPVRPGEPRSAWGRSHPTLLPAQQGPKCNGARRYELDLHKCHSGGCHGHMRGVSHKHAAAKDANNALRRRSLRPSAWTGGSGRGSCCADRGLVAAAGFASSNGSQRDVLDRAPTEANRSKPSITDMPGGGQRHFGPSQTVSAGRGALGLICALAP